MQNILSRFLYILFSRHINPLNVSIFLIQNDGKDAKSLDNLFIFYSSLGVYSQIYSHWIKVYTPIASAPLLFLINKHKRGFGDKPEMEILWNLSQKVKKSWLFCYYLEDLPSTGPICSSVRPKPGFGIGNRNQDQVSSSVSVP